MAKPATIRHEVLSLSIELQRMYRLVLSANCEGFVKVLLISTFMHALVRKAMIEACHRLNDSFNDQRKH